MIDDSQVIVLLDDVCGGEIWVRPRNYVAAEDSFSLTYLGMTGQMMILTEMNREAISELYIGGF